MNLLDGKIQIARAVGVAARASGRGGGTSLPGKVLLRLEPQAIRTLASRLRDGSAIISATNGKTTTAALTATILQLDGRTLVHNRTGANMAGGVASALLSASRGGARIDGDLGIFEVDEFWLATITDELQPRATLLGNLFRDQLDRYGELETIADRWADVVHSLPAASGLVLNADDPLIADLGRERTATYFGVDDDALALPEMQHASDSKHCRRCGTAYVYDAVYMGHLGRYHCPGCGQARPQPTVRAERIVLHGTTSSTFVLVTPGGEHEVSLRLPGLYNVYNALAAAALCLTLGVPLDAILNGLERTTAAFGRAETVELDGRGTARLLLVKNPAGANEVLRTLALEPEALDVLMILNDNIADGRDISWIWDADFELIAERVRRLTCSGTRAAEMAVRLKYAGVPPTKLAVEPALGAALDLSLDDADGAPLFILPTYTAMLALREELRDRGAVSAYWEVRA